MKDGRWAVNGIRKVLAGLRPFGESVWPGVRNDLFVAHESIYRFAARYCAGQRVLDAGCGTGYGAALLARGASSVSGIDFDPKSVRYARRHFTAPNLRYEAGDLEAMTWRESSFDVVIASNSLEHLHDPARVFRAVRDALVPGGRFLVAVPPVRNEHDLKLHAGTEYHRSVLSVDEWIACFREAGFVDLEFFLHQPREGVAPDFTSQRASALSEDDFQFIETTYEGLRMKPTLTAIFNARTPWPRER